MTFFAIARIIHILAGTVALVSLPLPALAKKGGKLHRRAGWAFVASIGTGAALSVALCVSRILDGWKNHPAAFFLLYVAIFTGAAAWVGVRALRGRLTGRKVVDLVFPVALAIGGVALAVYGAVLGAPLFVIFAALGLVSATMSFQAWRRPPVTKLDGILLHARAIGSACIATVTALVVVNAPHLGLGRWTLVPWVLPGVLGGVLLALSTRKLRRASAAAKASRANVTA